MTYPSCHHLYVVRSYLVCKPQAPISIIYTLSLHRYPLGTSKYKITLAVLLLLQICHFCTPQLPNSTRPPEPSSSFSPAPPSRVNPASYITPQIAHLTLFHTTTTVQGTVMLPHSTWRSLPDGPLGLSFAPTLHVLPE